MWDLGEGGPDGFLEVGAFEADGDAEAGSIAGEVGLEFFDSLLDEFVCRVFLKAAEVFCFGAVFKEESREAFRERR